MPSVLRGDFRLLLFTLLMTGALASAPASGANAGGAPSVDGGVAGSQLASDGGTSAAPAGPTNATSSGALADVPLEGEIRIRGGVTARSGSATQGGVAGLAFGGTTADTGVWLQALVNRRLGAFFSWQREGSSLVDASGPVGSSALVRFAAGPSGQLDLGPVRVVGSMGYQLAQLAGFATAAEAVTPITRHAVLVQAQASMGLPFGLRVEVEGGVPIGFAAAQGSLAGSSGGWFAGAAVGSQLLALPGYLGSLGLRLEYQHVSDSFTAPTLVAQQSLERFGLALVFHFGDATAAGAAGGAEISLLPHPAPLAANAAPGGSSSTAPFALSVKVVDKDTGAPIPSARVAVRDQSANADDFGVAHFAQAAAGPAQLEVSAPDYASETEIAQVVEGTGTQVTVALRHGDRVRDAHLTGTVRSTAGGAPVQAMLEIPQLSLTTHADARGNFSFTLPGGAGIFKVVLSAPGFLQQVKMVTVRDGETAIFNVDLHPEQ